MRGKLSHDFDATEIERYFNSHSLRRVSDYPRARDGKDYLSAFGCLIYRCALANNEAG
jgi:hypothetical protein